MKKMQTKLAQYRSTPSVSIFIPSELNSFADKESLILKLKENVIDAEIKLKKQYGEEISRRIGQSLRALVEDVDTGTLGKGIGLFASIEVAEKVNLPFAVVERTLIADRFDTADIDESIKLSSNYDVLVLSRKETRLFTGSGDRLTPVTNDEFPVSYKNEFQVKRPGQHSLYNNEESKINQARIDNYFRKIDKAMSSRDSKTPLVLVGTVENLSDYQHLKKSKQLVIGKIQGNMDHISVHELGKKTWGQIAEYISDRVFDDYHDTLMKVVGNVL